MFGDDDRDKLEALSAMARESIDKCLGNKLEAAERVKRALANDLRFADYDHTRLTDRLMLCRSNGARLELDDPELMRGGAPRPLSRSRW
jgi:hypothetical protein